jgi:hypothetical protein
MLFVYCSCQLTKRGDLSSTIRSNLTPGITRRPAHMQELESQRVGGRVHAVVMRPR